MEFNETLIVTVDNPPIPDESVNVALIIIAIIMVAALAVANFYVLVLFRLSTLFFTIRDDECQ